MPNPSDEIIAELEVEIEYSFQNKILLKTALTHRSYLHQKDKIPGIKEHNERLEFLGDAVLELIVTKHLFDNYKEDEGFLTALRAALVNYRNMGDVGKTLNLEKYLFLGKGEQDVYSTDRLALVANAMEAVIGALYLDGGYKPAEDFVVKYILPTLKEIIAAKKYRDSKTEFQEQVQKKFKVTPRYKVLGSKGKDHEKVFVSGVYIKEKLISSGEGRSKQEAETNAAEKGLEEIVEV